MNDDDLIADFIRSVSVDGETYLQVGVVRWSGPHEPEMAWTTVRRWKRPPTPERLDAAHRKALLSRRYFRVCQMCGERSNVGHMHDGKTCQSCAERHLGVVY